MVHTSAHSGPPLPPAALAGFATAVVSVVLMAVVSYQSQRRSTDAADAVTQGVEQLIQIQNLLSSTKDAETGQRGYLLTGDEAYLEPFNSGRAAIDGELKEIRALNEHNSAQLQRLEQLQGLVSAKMSELLNTVNLKRAGKSAEALEEVRTDRG